MKNLLFVILCVLGSFGTLNAQENEVSANELLHKAEGLAQEQEKNIFIIYHASWCSWCKQMISLMTSDELGNIFDENYIIMDLTVMEKDSKNDTPGAMKMMESQGGNKSSGLPFWVILDNQGEFLENSIMPDGINTGCPRSAEEVAYFRLVLSRTSNMTERELNLISEIFENPGKLVRDQ